ncbi:hypothetical protein [Haladaptatus sp. DYSN1]|uniref:DUF7122 family protein n=1 Tax=unclassified Haladaptatus TaxID=2622732 RepID=UPI002406E3F7|nr:hypothetical protein [Haladaptatus sp. DYSN1]
MSEDGNVGQQFDRLPETHDQQEVDGRASREQVVSFWHDRYGVPKDVFDDFSIWEKGAGKIWIFGGDVASPIHIEGLGMKFLRTRQEHWKPTTNAAQRFGRHATKNVIVLDDEQADRFAHGNDVDYPDWDGDWGYLIAAHELAGVTEPIGVGLYLHGELRSVVPKGRQFD